MTFAEFCRKRKLTKEEAEATARYLAFLRNERLMRQLQIEIGYEYSKKKKRNQLRSRRTK